LKSQSWANNTFNHLPRKAKVFIWDNTKLIGENMKEELAQFKFYYANIIYLISHSNSIIPKMKVFILLLSCLHLNAQNIETEKDDDVIFTTFGTPLSFPGGIDLLKSYLKNNVKYPEVHRSSGIKETAFMKSFVEKDGRISGVEQIKKCPKEFLSEADRVALNMPRWSPAKHGSKLVRCYYVVPIKFCELVKITVEC
jgi:hypothetical protein